MQQKNFLQWEAFEYYYQHKTSDWYWTLWIVAVAIAAISILLNNTVFGLLVLIIAFALSVFAARPAQRINCEVNEKGVVHHKTFYPYNILESFNFDLQNPNNPKLLLRSKKILIPLVTLPLENIDTYLLKDFLEHYLKQEDLQEPLLHKIMEYLGF